MTFKTSLRRLRVKRLLYTFFLVETGGEGVNELIYGSLFSFYMAFLVILQL